ncbi:MAG: aminotransferase class V-fold PLP-dependent enzyme [Nitrospirae bacterium]|nr:aminotransferase class V-fold PLP-dependent enzyme [Nitrospirota bacterium]
MKVQLTIPPAAAPIDLKDMFYGLTGIFFGKRYIEKLKKEVKKYFGINHVFLVSSGKASLFLILKALETLRAEKKQVLIPAYTCFSVPSAIVKAGLKVSLCDIDQSTFDFDYKLFNKAINKDTLCIVPNHLFGIPADMDKIKSICKNKDIFIVEDAAQAMGGSYKSKKLGTLGDVGFFSLGRGKNITCGSGGIIITNSSQIADVIDKHYSNLEEPGIIESLKEFLQVFLMSIFIRPALYWLPAGLPFLKLGQTIFYKDFPIKKLSGMKAGLLHGWQERLEKANQIRKENAKSFCDRLRLRSRLSNGNPVSLLRFPLIVESKETRDEIFSLSNKKGLGVSAMYPSSINEIEEIRSNFNGKLFPSAKKIADGLLTIPTHQLLSKKDKEKISHLFQVG